MQEFDDNPAAQLRALASRFRAAAAETHWPEYVALFETTASELDRVAGEAEPSADRPCLNPMVAANDMRRLLARLPEPRLRRRSG